MTGAIIQARLGSTRLPNKVLMELPKNSGISVLGRVITRLQKCTTLDNIYITTPDKRVIDEGKKYHVEGILYDGPRDVLKEFYLAARLFRIENIVRITADCPMIDSVIVDKVVKWHLRAGVDYTYNRCDGDGGGDGLDVEVFTFSALKKAFLNAIEPFDREHVTPYLRRGKFSVLRIPAPDFIGCSLNTIEDYNLLNALMGG